MRIVTRAAALAIFLALLFGLDHLISNPRLFNPVYYTLLIEIGRFAILAVSLTLINGITGQFSLGHAAFMAVGGYVSGIITYYAAPKLLGFPPAGAGNLPLNWNLIFLVAMIAGGLAASLVGLGVGLPSLRLRGDYLAIVTLGTGEVVRVALQHIDYVGGSLGFTGLPLITNFFWIGVVSVGTVLAIRNLKFSAHGRALEAIREDEIAAEAMGVPVTRYKVAAFVIGSFFAGLAGALYVHQVGSIYPNAAGFENSIMIVVMVVLGGSGSITGSVLAAALLTALPQILRASPTLGPNVEKYRMVIFAALLVVLMLTRPQGLFGAREISFRRLIPNRRKKSESPAS